jgi:radical SAM superfamily enzyme YgiQ (UPF0313 family)
MKILLVVKSKMMENLGVMYLSAVIKQAGHECRIADLKEVKSFWFPYREYDPDIVGFSVMTGDMPKFYGLKLWLTSQYCKTNKKPIFIVGGPDPTFFPQGYGWADYVFKGEAEQQIVDLFFHSGGPWCPYHDIDSLPWPDRKDFPNFKVRDFITSRGCPYRCRYCYNAKWSDMFPEQKGVRTRAASNVVAEIEAVNPEYVFFQDSCFGVSMRWMRDFASQYAPKVHIPYQCNLRPEQVKPAMVKLLKLSNCVAVRMALESASNRLRSMVGRGNINLTAVRYACELLRKAKIKLMLQNIIGLPTSTIEDDLFTLETNIAYAPTYAWVSIYQPYPGTELGDQCKAEGQYKGDYSDITDSFFETSHLDFSDIHREQLEILQKIFALCVDKKYMPEIKELTYKNLPALIHKIMRKDGDRKLYLGVL